MSPVFDSGQITSTLTTGSNTIGRAFSIASRNAFLPADDERDFLRVHRMMLAIVDDHADILQRKAGNRTGEKHLLDALLHRRHELVRDDPALRLVEELEAAPRSRGSTRSDTSPN
jgi:hypothetical protein